MSICEPAARRCALEKIGTPADEAASLGAANAAARCFGVTMPAQP